MRGKNLDFLLPLLALICLTGTANAQPNMTDTALLATANTPLPTMRIAQEANVVFPAILSGNEAPAMDYVESFSAKRRDYLIRTHDRGKRFFAKAAAILKKYHLPQELKVLLALESGFNGNAVSGAGAVGYWQLMDETAKEYGLRIVPLPTQSVKNRKATYKLSPDSLAKLKKQLAREQAKDERRHFQRSTHAAARYLRDRSRNLHNDWLLVVASYNCGIGNVWEAMAKSGKLHPTYWDIKEYLPAETRGYVANFIALNVVYNNYDNFLAGKMVFKTIGADGDRFEQTISEALAAPSLK